MTKTIQCRLPRSRTTGFCHIFRVTIKLEIARNIAMLDRILSDIPNQSANNLVDGVEETEEEKYSYEHYYGTQKHQVFSTSYR